VTTGVDPTGEPETTGPPDSDSAAVTTSGGDETGPSPTSGPVDPTADATTRGDDSTGGDADTAGVDDGGCGCRGASDPSGALLLLGLLGLRRRRG
jgi:MYXO-CTERM domain-containing protein